MRNMCAVACLIAVGWAAAAQVIEVPLEYVKQPTDREMREAKGDMLYIPSGYMQPELKDSPEKPLALPDLAKHNVRYTSFTLGDTTFPLALARAANGKKFEYTLYIDANGNGTAADDTPIQGMTHGDDEDPYVSCQFEPYDLEYQLGDKKLPLCVQFYLWEEKPTVRSSFSQRNSYFNMSTAAGYSGQFALNGRNYRLILGDGKLNGRFGDKMEMEQRDNHVWTEGDCLILAAPDEKAEYWNTTTVTDYVFLENDVYKLAIDVPNGKLTMTRYDGALAPLKLPPEVQRLEAASPDNSASISFVNPPTSVKVPAGAYKMTSYLLSRKEAVGDVWRLMARATGRTPVCTVDGAGTAQMMFGEPYNSQLTEQHLRRTRTMDRSDTAMAGAVKEAYELQMGVTGCAFEEVAALEHVSGDKTQIPLSARSNRQPKEPTYKIVTEEGETLASGSFEYG
ncbi:MAG: hypothetical protein IMZ62_15630 [Chloroflexi bacterium]|nr:hypothetical protein [Chloroflexota bacterium]